MPWTRKPAIEGRGPVCACCGTPTTTFSADAVIAVGFGSSSVTRDGVAVYDENRVVNERDFWDGADAERAAAADPDHDWQIRKFGPLYSAIYQRHAAGQWVLIERGDGFA